YDDEIGYTSEFLGLDVPASEFNILEGLWNARVTSHVPLSQVASLVTTPRVLEDIRLTDASLRDAGFDRPRIAVAGLNPHAGDGVANPGASKAAVRLAAKMARRQHAEGGIAPAA